MPPAQLATWVAELALAKPDLVAKLRAMLAQHESNREAQFLEHSLLAPTDEPVPGDQVGADMLDRLLGTGGMGTVCLARLFDAGIRDTGQPHLILEYVEAERIDRYCGDRALRVPARLRPLLRVRLLGRSAGASRSAPRG